MQNAETVLGVLRERLTQQSLESRMIGKPSRPVRREAARKRTCPTGTSPRGRPNCLDQQTPPLRP
jgi:hypothetical protein